MKRLAAILVLIAAPALAVGPKLPRILTFTPSPSVGVTGYWLYWRVLTGTYNDTNRRALSTNAWSGFDLSALGLPKGQYWLAGSATNAAAAESDLSVEAFWDYNNPNRPSNLEVAAP